MTNINVLQASVLNWCLDESRTCSRQQLFLNFFHLALHVSPWERSALCRLYMCYGRSFLFSPVSNKITCYVVSESDAGSSPSGRNLFNDCLIRSSKRQFGSPTCRRLQRIRPCMLNGANNESLPTSAEHTTSESSALLRVSLPFCWNISLTISSNLQ